MAPRSLADSPQWDNFSNLCGLFRISQLYQRHHIYWINQLQTLIFSRSIGLNNEKIVIRLKFSFLRRPQNLIIFHLIWRLLSKMSNKVEDCFKYLWPFQNVWTLPVCNSNLQLSQSSKFATGICYRSVFISPIFSPSIRRCDFGKKIPYFLQ